MRLINTLIVLFIAVLFVAGCNPKAQSSDEAEREHPAMKKARDLEVAGEIEAARFTYQALLDKDPTMARAHLALALLLDQGGSNGVEVIYHYQRYLALRPDTEKRKMIDDHIRNAQLEFVGSIFSNQTAILRRIGELERENAALMIRNTNLEAQSTQLRTTVAVLRGRGHAQPEPAEAQAGEGNVVPLLSGGRWVRVEKGDTLRVIAIRYFGNQERWPEILEINRGRLKNPESLRVGQMILVPERKR